MKKKIIILALLAMTSCAPALHDAVVVAPPPVAIPQVQPLTLNNVQWDVLTNAELQALLKSNSPVALYALTPDDYRNMSANFIEIQRYIEEQKAANKFLADVVNSRSMPPAKVPTQP